MIGHAGDSNDLDYLTELANAGVLPGMDRFGLGIFNPGAERIKTIAVLAARGYAASMVLAHDANCFIDYFGAAHDMGRAAGGTPLTAATARPRRCPDRGAALTAALP